MQIPKIDAALSPTFAETFLIERTIELLSSASIESYRLPLHNPRTILIEITSVIRSYQQSEITKDEYANLLADEVYTIFKHETYLTFNSISRKFLEAALKKRSLNDIYYAANLILSHNTTYITDLFNKMTSLIGELNAKPNLIPADFSELNEVLKYFLIELRELGYSKAYLYRYITAIFYSATAGTFQERVNLVRRLIIRDKEHFSVIIGFVIKPDISSQLEILDPTLQKVNPQEIPVIIQRTNKRVRDFFSQSPDNTFYRIELESPDYYSASNQVRKNLQLVLDVLYMGYSGEEFALNPKCVVVGNVNAKLAGVHNLNYQLEGYFNNNQDLYRQFSEKITSIKERNISAETLTRIDAALRYLRLGSEVREVENKLLNYWIGMEYFFASNDSTNSKTDRMRDYFKRIHGKIYFKRLLLDFHRNIRLHALHGTLANYNDDLNYLSAASTFTQIETNTASPLLAFRACKLRERLFDRKKLTDDLKRHVSKVEWNLVRIYRLRNAIVHSAKGGTNILDITSHLRYYLIFVINSAIDYMNNNPVDINKDGIITLEDYFLVNKIEYENLIMDDSVTVESLLRIRNPIEFLT